MAKKFKVGDSAFWIDVGRMFQTSDLHAEIQRVTITSERDQMWGTYKFKINGYPPHDRSSCETLLFHDYEAARLAIIAKLQGIKTKIASECNGLLTKFKLTPATMA